MKKIAIIRRNGLGDLLCTYPLICHLKKIYPQTEITLFIDQSNACLLPFFTEKLNAVVIPKKGNKYFNLIKLAIKHSFENYDLAISAKTSPMKMMNLFLFFLRAKKRVAYVEKKTFLVNQGVIFDRTKSLHQSLKGLKLIDPNIEDVPKEYEPSLKVSEELKLKYAKKVKGLTLLISGSTTNEKSRLDEKRYAALASRAYEEFGFISSLVSLEKDRRRAEEIAKHLKCPYAIHFPRNFEEFMVLLDEANLYFVGDGGSAHIGAGLKKHQLVLFGATSSAIWRPLNERAFCLEEKDHINCIPDEKIWASLKNKGEEVVSARNYH